MQLIEERVGTLKLLDAEILNDINDEVALAEEIEQSDKFMEVVYAAIIRAEKGYPTVPPETDPAGHSGAVSATKSNRVVTQACSASILDDIT